MIQTRQDNYFGVWNHRLGFGRKMALVVVDFLKSYTTEGSPFFAPGVVSAVARTPELLMAARKAGILIVHANILYHHPNFADAGVWAKKSPIVKSLVAQNPLSAFCDEAAPLVDEIVITKQYASAFFGTALASTLHSQAVDTILLAGCTTSGCIRASAVDAMQYGFRPMVVRDCVGDRHAEPHEANLFDIDAKYGDIVSLSEVFLQLSAKIDS